MKRRIGQRAAGASLVFALAASFALAAQESAVEAQALYLQECSKCHGLLAEARASAWPAKRRLRPSLAFALPYGPGLRGVYGKPAGRVPGYDYSSAFRQTLQGVVWDAENLDEYLRDSQARAPGIRMFYRQPDPAIRRKIIALLRDYR